MAPARLLSAPKGSQNASEWRYTRPGESLFPGLEFMVTGLRHRILVSGLELIVLGLRFRHTVGLGACIGFRFRISWMDKAELAEDIFLGLGL